MARIESWFEQDLKKPVPVRKLEGVFNEDSQANVIGVQLYDDGVALTSISGSVTGYFLLADGTTTSISGTKSGGKASVVIPPAAYKVTGPITITIRITDGSNITTVCACVGLVMLTKTPVATPAGSTVADWSAQISAQLAACQAAADAVGATVAVPFNEAVANDAGTYVTSSGHMYYLPNGHAANVSLANTTKVETNCGKELTSLKNALTNTDNLLDLYAITSDYKLNKSTGAVVTGSGNAVSDFISINPTNVIYASRDATASTRMAMSGTFCFYDEDKKFISGSGVSGSDATAPTGAAYVRYSTATFINTANSYRPMLSMATNGLAYSDYHPFSVVATGYPSTLEKINYLKSNIIDPINVDLEETNAFLVYKNGYNLLDTFFLADNTKLSDGGGLATAIGWCTTDFIKINPTETVYASRAATQTTRMAMGNNVFCFYDSNKNFINGSKSTSSSATAPSSAVYFRYSGEMQFVKNVSGYRPMLSIAVDGLSQNDYYPFNPFIYGYETLANKEKETNRKIDQIVRNDNIVCWGDSLTYGSGSTSGNDYCSKLASKTGLSVARCGCPGDDSALIGGVQSGLPLWVEPVTIPASGSVNITLTEYPIELADHNPFRFPSICRSFVNPVTIDGVEGTLDLSASENTSTKVFSFTRTNSGNAHTIYYRVPLLSAAAKNYRERIAVIWVGTNGGWNETPETLIRQIKDMVSVVIDQRFIVLGIPNLTTETGSALEAAMENAFGSHYINVRKSLVAGGLEENGIIATSTDEADIAVGRIPTSLRSDGTHLNNYGYNSVANLVYMRGKFLGYWQ